VITSCRCPDRLKRRLRHGLAAVSTVCRDHLTHLNIFQHLARYSSGTSFQLQFLYQWPQVGTAVGPLDGHGLRRMFGYSLPLRFLGVTLQHSASLTCIRIIKLVPSNGDGPAAALLTNRNSCNVVLGRAKPDGQLTTLHFVVEFAFALRSFD